MEGARQTDAGSYILGREELVECGPASSIRCILHNLYLHPHLSPEPRSLCLTGWLGISSCMVLWTSNSVCQVLNYTILAKAICSQLIIQARILGVTLVSFSLKCTFIVTKACLVYISNDALIYPLCIPNATALDHFHLKCSLLIGFWYLIIPYIHYPKCKKSDHVSVLLRILQCLHIFLNRKSNFCGC